jgi:putative phage-type endonuclease
MSDADLSQRSEEWKTARVGSLGASCVHEVVARTKSGWGASRQNRLAALVVERLTGQPQDTYMNAAMQQGIDLEPAARAAYAFDKDVDVVEVGLVRHPTIDKTHASPDGLVGDDGLVEIKCPQPAAHLATLLHGDIPDKYETQMQWQMACTTRQWCDFASYNPAFPEHLRLYVRRIMRDDTLIAELEKQVTLFLDQVAAAVSELDKPAA